MDDISNLKVPSITPTLEAKCQEIEFPMPSDLLVGTLLKTLISSKQSANILELGTGIGLSLAWMIEGLDENARITSIDNDPELIKIAQHFFQEFKNVNIICEDGSSWIKNYSGELFDLVFADAWPGKYSEIDEILSLVKLNGFYIIDDMESQANWPKGHQEQADKLVDLLESRTDFNLTKLNWSTGIIIAVRIK